MKPMKFSFTMRTIGIAIAGLCLIAVAAWQMSARPPILLVAAIDGSGSYEPCVRGAIKRTMKMSERLYGEDSLTVLRFTRQTEEIHSGPVADPDGLRAVLVKRFSKRKEQDGTFPDVLWEDLETRLFRIKIPFAVAVWTDGDMDDKSPEAISRMKAAVANVARNPNCVSVTVYGVLPQNRKELTEALGSFGDRLHFFDSAEVDTEPLMGALEAARYKKQKP